MRRWSIMVTSRCWTFGIGCLANFFWQYHQPPLRSAGCVTGLGRETFSEFLLGSGALFAGMLSFCSWTLNHSLDEIAKSK